MLTKEDFTTINNEGKRILNAKIAKNAKRKNAKTS